MGEREQHLTVGYHGVRAVRLPVEQRLGRAEGAASTHAPFEEACWERLDNEVECWWPLLHLQLADGAAWEIELPAERTHLQLHPVQRLPTRHGFLDERVEGVSEEYPQRAVPTEIGLHEPHLEREESLGEEPEH